MEIPYTVRPRPDTGLTNPKLGIWLFLASEVMLFGGLFAGYIFMRLGSEPWMWPHGWLNVPVGTFNTFVLIFSSVTVILSWEALKMHKYRAFKNWLAVTWVCGLLFLGVKLGIEWPAKFRHFGAYVTKEAAHKYEKYLGNEDTIIDGKSVQGRRSRAKEDPALSERLFISGHPADMEQAKIPYIPAAQLDGVLDGIFTLRKNIADTANTASDRAKATMSEKTLVAQLPTIGIHAEDAKELLNAANTPEQNKEARAKFLAHMNVIHIHALDLENAHPYDADNDRPHFITRDPVDVEHVVLNKADLLPKHGAFLPKLNTYLACYFMITGLHGLHVLGGSIVFFYFWLNIKGGAKLYKTNHQQLCNRIEVAGLFWHLVDLIWIFVFPLFYLL